MKKLDTINPIPICRHCVYFAAAPSGNVESAMCFIHKARRFSTNTCDSFDPFVMSNEVRVNFGGDDDNSPVPA